MREFGSNPVFWSRQRLYWLADTMQEILQQDERAGRELIKKVKNKSQCDEALTLLKDHHFFQQAGFSISFFPRLSKSRKIPDLALSESDTHSRILVETSSLQEPEESSEAWEVMKAIECLLDAQGIHFSYKYELKRRIRKDEIIQLLEFIHLCLLELHKTGGLQILDNDMIRLHVTQPADYQLLEECHATGPMSDGSTGWLMPNREPERIWRALNREKRQLPEAEPHLISLHIRPWLPRPPLEAQVEFGRQLFLAAPHCDAIILSESAWDTEEFAPVFGKDFVYVRQTIAMQYGLRRLILFSKTSRIRDRLYPRLGSEHTHTLNVP